MSDNIYQQSFWDDEDGELWGDVASPMLEVYLQGVNGGVDALPPDVRVLVDFDRVNTDALAWARQYHYDKIRGITDITRQQTQKAVGDWISSGAPLDALEQVLEGIYGSKRAERIAVTEATRVFAQGNMEAWESTGLIGSAHWMTSQDELVCETCGGLSGTEIGIGDIDAAPPAHPNCRCWLQPIVSEQALERQLDEVLYENDIRLEGLVNELGIEPPVSYGGQGYEFSVGDNQYKAAGSYNPTTGKITIYDGAFQNDETLKSVLIHEWTHDGFRDFRRVLDEQSEEIMRLAREIEDPKLWPIRLDGYLRPEYKEQFWAYDIQQRYFTGDAFKELLEKDGVTPYSRAYWDAWKAGGGRVTTDMAINETLAEIASVDSRKEGKNVSKIWRKLYNEVFYD
jgi:SPP1 gp7 family putative phage head morphogenesis protein